MASIKYDAGVLRLEDVVGGEATATARCTELQALRRPVMPEKQPDRN
jgi:hypothetical protein